MPRLLSPDASTAAAASHPRLSGVASLARVRAAALAAGRPARRAPGRRALLPAAYLGAILLVPLLVGVANLGNTWRAGEPLQAPAFARALPAPPTPDPSKKIAVVLSSAYGAEITDSLPTFEILARSGAFDVYSVAPERTVLPLVASTLKATGLDFVPHFSYAEYEAHVGRAPDLIAIPYFPGYSRARDAAVLDWIRAHAGPDTTVLTICAGTEPLADTGLLDGRTATTNTGWFEALEARVPTATWVRGVRYVDDGNIVTSTNLAAGIDATLHVVDRFAGRATALDVARQIGYTQTGALDDPRFEPPAISSYLAPALADAAFAGRQRLGVLLYDGVSELGLAGLLDPYGTSLSAGTVVMAPERTVVRSRDGFLFVPRDDFGTVPTLDRVLVPAGADGVAKQQTLAAWSAIRPGRPAEDISRNVGSGETAYDAGLQDLARTRNAGVARAVAIGLFYAAASPDFPDAAWPVAEALTVVALGLLGAAAVFGATHIKLSRRARSRPTPQPA
jgi:putative intracellular protease/amidase